MYKKGVWVQLIFFLSVLFSSLCVVLVLKIKLAVYKPLLENLISLLVSVLLFIFDGFLCWDSENTLSSFKLNLYIIIELSYAM